MSANDNPTAEAAEIGEALVASLGFEPTEGRTRGRKAASSTTDTAGSDEETNVDNVDNGDSEPSNDTISLDAPTLEVSADELKIDKSDTKADETVAVETETRGAGGSSSSSSNRNNNRKSKKNRSRNRKRRSNNARSNSGSGSTTGGAAVAGGETSTDGEKSSEEQGEESPGTEESSSTDASSNGESSTATSDSTAVDDSPAVEESTAVDDSPAVDDSTTTDESSGIESETTDPASDESTDVSSSDNAESVSEGAEVELAGDDASSDTSETTTSGDAESPTVGFDTSETKSESESDDGVAEEWSVDEPLSSDLEGSTTETVESTSGEKPNESEGASDTDRSDSEASDSVSSNDQTLDEEDVASTADDSVNGVSNDATSIAFASPGAHRVSDGESNVELILNDLVPEDSAEAAATTSELAMDTIASPPPPSATDQAAVLDATKTTDVPSLESPAEPPPPSAPQPAKAEADPGTASKPATGLNTTVSDLASRAGVPPAVGDVLSKLPLRRDNRVQARKVRRVVRHIDPWSVLTFSVLFHLCLFAALLLASVLVWNAAEAAGTIENLEAFILELGDYDKFEIKGEEVFRAAVAIAGIMTLASSVLMVLLTVVFNLISDLIGGIRLTVIEEETIRVKRRKKPVG